MRYGVGLYPAGAFFHFDAASVVFADHPAFEHVKKLKLDAVQVSNGDHIGVTGAQQANHMGLHHAARGLLHPQIAVSGVAAQACFKFATFQVLNHEVLRCPACGFGYLQGFDGGLCGFGFAALDGLGWRTFGGAFNGLGHLGHLGKLRRHRLGL